MAAVMLAGMVPPLALALATVVRPQLFNLAERENGKAAVGPGRVVHHRGCDPVRRGRPAARDPVDHGRQRAHRRARRWRMEVSLRAPHGGIFVLFAVGQRPGLLHRPARGTSLLAAGLVIVLKSHRHLRRRRRYCLTHPPSGRPAPSAARTAPSSSPEPKERPCPASPSSSAPPSACTPARPRSSPRPPAELGSEVTINGVDASSALLIMTLGAGCGDTVEVAGDVEADVDAIAALVVQDLDA